jgi:phospholipase C
MAGRDEQGSAMELIDHWVVLMFENRSFDNLLGHLPHIDPADGIRGRDVGLTYPGGTVKVRPAADFRAPLPDPGEAFGNVNVQCYGQYVPASNAGKAAYRIFPGFFETPYNAPPAGTVAAMDGFALDYYWNFKWEKERFPTDAEMQNIGAVLTPETAPVINTLAREYAVFTHWHCEVPACTTPNRNFFFCGTNQGRIDNEFIYNYGWDFEQPSIFSILEDKGAGWAVYFEPSQKVPMCSLSLGGARHRKMWRSHSRTQARFFADCAAGALPAFSWVEPKMFFGDELNDYHPPHDVRLAEHFLAGVYNAVRNSPQWEKTALIVTFDEHGGTYDHVPPPAAPIPDDFAGEQGFAFDRFGVRVPTIVISPYTRRETVIRDLFHSTSVLHTMRERFGLGPALTKRDEAAPLLTPAFNLTEPRKDAPERIAPPSLADVDLTRGTALGDDPDAKLFLAKHKDHALEPVSQLGHVVLRNVAAMSGKEVGDIPPGLETIKSWLGERVAALHDHDAKD